MAKAATTGKKRRRQYRRQNEYAEEGGTGLFLWSIVIVLLAGAAFVCWAGSIYVFGHPEKPFSYSLLQKFKRIEPPKKFELKRAPRGEYLSAQKFMAAYGEVEGPALKGLNESLVRAFLRNYEDTKLNVPYLTGRYRVTQIFELQNTDLFPSGVVVLADSLDEPGLAVEYIYSADKDNIPRIMRPAQTGSEIELRRTHELSAVTYLERLPGDRMVATVINLNYGSYTPSEGTGGFALSPPTHLNIESGWPIIKPVSRDGTALATSTMATPTPARPHRLTDTPDRPIPTPGRLTPPPVPAQTPSLAAVTPGRPAVTPPQISIAAGSPVVPRAIPGEERIARALPVSTPTPVQIPTTAPVEERVARALPVTQPPVASLAQPPAQVPVQAPSDVPMVVGAPAPTTAAPPVAQPIVSASGPTQAGGSWATYSPGQMPRGRLVDSTEATRLAEEGMGPDRYYMSGQFLVTAADRSRAIMRPKGNSGRGEVRFIVDYPGGMLAPREGSVVAKADDSAFQITNVQRSANGVVNVYLREVVPQ